MKRLLRGMVGSMVVCGILAVGAVSPAGARASVRSAIPPTPTLVVALHQGVETDGHLTAAQRAHIAADIRWLHDRLNITLPRIRWTGSALRKDGVFDADTTTAVTFFKSWANASRALLHESPLFARVDGVMDTQGVAILAIVGAYFQAHPAPALANPTSVSQLSAYLLTSADLLRLETPGFTNPSAATWKVTSTTSSDTTEFTSACTPGAPTPASWVERAFDYTDSSGSYGTSNGKVMHFDSAASAQKYANARTGATFVSCYQAHQTQALAQLAGGNATSSAISTLPAVGSGPAYRVTATIVNPLATCPYYSDIYTVPMGSTVVQSEFETCHNPWSATLEAALVQDQVNRLIVHR